MSELIKIQDVEQHIIMLRDQKVILDSDVAALYGVETKRVNEAVKNNPDKFPDGYLIQTTDQEAQCLRSKFSTLNKPGRGQHIKYNPVAFTERGLYMLATILKGSVAIQTTIAIVDTFAQIRELSRTVFELSNTKEEKVQKQLMQKGGDIMAEVLGSELHTSETETTFKLNLAVLSFEHTTKRTKPK